MTTQRYIQVAQHSLSHNHITTTVQETHAAFHVCTIRTTVHTNECEGVWQMKVTTNAYVKWTVVNMYNQQKQ